MQHLKRNLFSIATFSLLAPTLVACSAEHEDIDPPAESVTRSQDADALDPETYYAVRPDYRKCVFPMCGGYWLSEVNVPTTTCADGTVADSSVGCYVSELELHGIELGEGDLIHGEFVKKDYEGFGTMDTFDADGVFKPLFEQEREYYFRYNLLTDNGIVCITQPCPSTDIAKINTPYAWQDPFTFEEAGYYGVDELALLDAFYADYNERGVIVDSHWHSPWMTGAGWELSIHNVLVRHAPMCLTVRHASDDSIVAWNVTSHAQASAILGDPQNWLWHELSEGTCADVALSSLCTEEYAPLCATIDVTGQTQTHSNECYMTQAVRMAAGDDAKATGTSTKGACEQNECHLEDPAYTYVGTSPEQCAVINFFCPEGESYFSDDCGCGCVDDSAQGSDGAGPGELCGGFANVLCVEGLSCDGLGDNGSTVGVCTCPEWINCFPGPNSEPCDLSILDICPDTQVAY
jgi:hypothetical protein